MQGQVCWAQSCCGLVGPLLIILFVSCSAIWNSEKNVSLRDCHTLCTNQGCSKVHYKPSVNSCYIFIEECKPPWEDKHGRCIKLATTPKVNWHASVAVCQSEGATLATLQGLPAADVYSIVDKLGCYDIAIGGQKNPNTTTVSSWTWLDGTATGSLPWGKWEPSFPAHQHCLMIRMDPITQGIHDCFCTNKYMDCILCQKPYYT